MKKKILVISQEGHLRDLLKTELEQEGYGVLLAETGQKAVGQSRRTAPDLVLVDTVLSDLDGEEILRRFEEETTPPPIVVWSAHDSGGDFWSIDAYILKTPNFFKIKSKIKELCPAEVMQGEEAVTL